MPPVVGGRRPRWRGDWYLLLYFAAAKAGVVPAADQLAACAARVGRDPDRRAAVRAHRRSAPRRRRATRSALSSTGSTPTWPKDRPAPVAGGLWNGVWRRGPPRHRAGGGRHGSAQPDVYERYDRRAEGRCPQPRRGDGE